MKSLVAVGCVSAIALLAGLSAAQADDKIGLGAGDILVHGRALGAFPDARGHDDLAGHTSSIDLGNSFVPEVDVSYFFTDHIAAELIAATTRHSVTDKTSNLGNLDLGHVWLLPPTLTAQYHPLARNAWDPYVGAGVNYSVFYGAGGAKDIGGKHTTTSYDDNFGFALQAGVNYQVSNAWFVNFDVKKIWVSTTAHVNNNGTHLTNAKTEVNPLLIGVGVGYRF